MLWNLLIFLIRKQHKLRLAVAENFAQKTFVLGEGLRRV